MSDVRKWFYYPIEMPLTCDGQGPATVGVDAASISYEVWDILLNTHSSHNNLPDAINEAMRLNALLNENEMSDEELLLHQLKNPPTMSMALNKDHLYRMMADHMKGAADHIDELKVSLQAVLNREAATTARYDAKTDELEAKLAKATELLRRHCDPMDMSNADVATLAELEGNKDE